MTERRLGRTDIRVTPIGLGCWQFSGGEGLLGGYWPALPQAVVNDIVGASLNGGVRWFDTAEAYGAGRSEAALAAALQAGGQEDGSVVIATKWLPRLRTAGSIGRTIGVRLRHLAPYSIDLHQIHTDSHALATKRAQLDAMARLVEAGRIRAVGVSNFSARAMHRASRTLARHGLCLASNQVRYNLLDRRIESNGVMETARELGATIIAYSPLAQGLLSGVFHDHPERLARLSGPRLQHRAFQPDGLNTSAPVVQALRSIAATHGATPAQVALRWLVQAQGDVVVAIPGASSPDQARENAGALRIELTEAEISALDHVSEPFR